MFISAPEGDRLLVEEIIEAVGLRPVYVGEDQETIIDALFQLWIALALKQRRGRPLALRLLEDCGTPTLVWGSLDSLAAEGSLQISVAAWQAPTLIGWAQR